MPPSKIIPNLRYGWTGFSSINTRTNEQTRVLVSYDANFDVSEDGRIRERISMTPDGIRVSVLLNGYPILED